MVLVNFKTYYSFPNIDESNNMSVYSPDNGNSWAKLKIPRGVTKLMTLVIPFITKWKKRGHHDPVNEDYFVNISANPKP